MSWCFGGGRKQGGGGGRGKGKGERGKGGKKRGMEKKERRGEEMLGSVQIIMIRVLTLVFDYLLLSNTGLMIVAFPGRFAWPKRLLLLLVIWCNWRLILVHGIC